MDFHVKNRFLEIPESASDVSYYSTNIGNKYGNQNQHTEFNRTRSASTKTKTKFFRSLRGHKAEC